MRKNSLINLGILICMFFLLSNANYASNQANKQPIKTNKDKLLTLAVQGQIAPAEPASSYATTWDGKAKMTIGIGGINYNLKIGEKVFGWASGDRATVGVATEGAGPDRARASYLNFTSIGNEAKILRGEAKGEKGIIIGKFGSFVLVHFDDDVLEKLAIGDTLHIKASGLGLKIDGFDDVFAHSIAPDVLEKIVMKTSDGKLEAPVVKEIPADLISRGSGGSLSGHWHIQTSYPRYI